MSEQRRFHDQAGAAAPAAEGQGEHRRQVGVVHPALHDIGRGGADQPRQAQQAARRRTPAAHAQVVQRDAGGGDAFGLGAARDQGDNGLVEAERALRGEGGQHRLGAPGLEPGDDMQDADRRRGHGAAARPGRAACVRQPATRPTER
jgi:hypothetical protein